MKVTVGGSYHEPGWTAVCNLIKKLKEAGHEVLAPGEEWVPVNKDDNFVKFKGEEEKSITELQNGFFDKMGESDAYIICNPNSYEGMAVSMELGYASAMLLHKTSNLKQIYFMEPPLGYSLFKARPAIKEKEFEEEIHTNPKYINELNYYRKFLNITDEGFGYTCFSDFYADLRDHMIKVLTLEKMGFLTIGLESLLTPKKGELDFDDESR